jgi:chromate transport protein ChrA
MTGVVSFAQAFRFWLKLSFISFGGLAISLVL